jgi:pyruvate,water dikinase
MLPLDSPLATLEVAGGKGTSLSELARAGFPVPPGFVVGTEAYRAFVAANALAERIAAAARGATVDDPAACEAVSREIRALFEAGEVPEEMASAIADAYRELAGGEASGGELAVAVRSSATAEDLPEASFAGQQETYLNVRGEAALLAAVKRCWASLWTARALAYRARRGIDPAAVSLAVVVQRLVPADAAGILFTVDPVSGDPERVVINAAWGLGEAIVSGQVTPDTVVADKRTGRVLEASVGDKAVMTALAPDGTAEVAVDAPRREQAALSAEQAAALARLGREIEAHFGGPQDVEWAVAGGQAYVLQARPVTALPGAQPTAAVPGDDAWPALGERPAQPFDLWTQADMGERWPEPVTPLTWSTAPAQTSEYTRYSFRDLKVPYLAETQWAKRFYGRVYLNEGALGHVCREEYGLPMSFMASALGSGVDGATAARERIRLPRLLRAIPGWVPLTIDRMRNEGRYERLFPRIDRWVADFMRRDLSPASDQALWDELERVWNRRLAYVLRLHSDASSTAMAALPMLERLAARWCGRKEVAHELLTGIAGLRTAEMVPALWRMAQTARELGLAPAILQEGPGEALAALRATERARPLLALLDAFLAEHGHRGGIEAELLYPRWAEAPEQVVEAVAGYLRAGDQVDPLEAEARQRRRRAATLAAVDARLDPIRRAVFRGMLARTEHLVRLRDNGQHYVVKLLLPVRRLYATLGERWAARGWLERADDVFFLAVPEIEAVVRTGDPATGGRHLPTVVAERRKAYAYWFDVKAPEAVGPDGRPLDVAPADPSALSGIAASGGRVEGMARVIETLADANRLRPGEILVTRATDPSWTPLFPLAGGLVLEVGGQLSHGAIVAREYGLPAVVNVPDATRRIRDGQVVVVDGTAGRVYLKDAPAAQAESAGQELVAT